MPAGASSDPAVSRRRAIWIRLIVSPLTLLAVLAVLRLHDRSGSALPSDLLLCLAGAGAAWELARMVRVPGGGPAVIPAVVASGLVCGVGLLAPHDAALRGELRVLIPLALLLGVLVVRMGDLRGEATVGAALTLLPVAFVGVPFGLVREIGDEASLARWLAYVVVVAKASDIGGWLVGKPFGRHKLLPSVSPGKSWEGLAGGLGLSVLAAVLLPAPLSIAAEWSGARRVAFGLVLGGASVLAGLLHSAFKRRVGTKDSGRLIPEIGGVLDIVDSMLLAAPAAWLWFRLGLG